MWYLVAISLFAGAGGLLFGYDIGVVVATLPLLRSEESLSDLQAEAVVGHTKIGAAVGAFVAALLFRYGHGPRRVLCLSNLAFVCGPVLMAFAHGWVQIALGRLLTGIGIGLSCVTAPMYLGDIAPASSRGAVVTCYELMLTVGVLCSSLVCYSLQQPGPSAFLRHLLPSVPLWRTLFVLPSIPAFLLLLCSFGLPDPPARLVELGHIDRAFDLLLRLHNYRPHTSLSLSTMSSQRLGSGLRVSGRTSERNSGDVPATDYTTRRARLMRFSSGSTEESFSALPLSPSGEHSARPKSLSCSCCCRSGWEQNGVRL